MKKLAIFLTSLSLIACTNQQITPTQQATLIQRATPARQVAKTYQWDAQPALIQLYESAPYSEFNYAWSIMPKLVVYSDGRVIKTNLNHYLEQDAWTQTIKLSHISSGEICSLLSQIDASGFFDFDPNDHQAPDIREGGSTAMIVQAWQSKSVEAYEIEHSTELPVSLSGPYRLLSFYDPPDAKPYQPDRIALLIWLGRPGDKYQPWPATFPPLKTLAPNLDYDDTKVVVFTGQDAIEAYTLFEKASGKLFSEDGLGYHVTFRPLLPQEIVESIEGWSPSRFEDTPKTKLICDTKAIGP